MDMDIDECKRLLHLHATLRMPKFRREFEDGEAPHSASEKVDLLETFLGDAAIARGDLEEARLWADHIRHTLEDDWNGVEGWQQSVSSKATGPQIMEAKREIRPDLYDAMRETKWVTAKLTDQIRRLEKDEENASRRYTLLVGS